MCLVILRGVNRLCGLLSVALLALGMVGFAAPAHANPQQVLEGNYTLLLDDTTSTVPMIAHAAGITLDEITTGWEKWVTALDLPLIHGVGTIR